MAVCHTHLGNVSVAWWEWWDTWCFDTETASIGAAQKISDSYLTVKVKISVRYMGSY